MQSFINRDAFLTFGHSRRMNVLLLAAVTSALCLFTFAASVPAETLSGRVKTENVRIARPRGPVLHGAANSAAAAEAFSSGLQQQSAPESAPGDISLKPLPPLSSKPLIPAGAAKTESTSGSGSAGGAPANFDYSYKPKPEYKSLVIRLKRFRSLQEMENVWEASRTAIRMLKKGAQVTILLDMEGVHAADRNDTMGAYNEANRGNGNQAAERLTSPQDHLTQFVSEGGKLVVSARWVKLFAISQGALIPGARLASEDEIDDILLDPSTTVVDY